MARTLSPALAHADPTAVRLVQDDPNAVAYRTCRPEAWKKHPIWLLRQKQITWCRMPDVAAKHDCWIPRSSSQLLRLASFAIGWSIAFDLQPHLVRRQPEIR
jgi:hypothetical protein